MLAISLISFFEFKAQQNFHTIDLLIENIYLRTTHMHLKRQNIILLFPII